MLNNVLERETNRMNAKFHQPEVANPSVEATIPVALP
jgi:hypothetical protein